MRKDLNSLTLDIIGESAFDYKFNSLSGFNSEESQATDRLLRCAFDFRRKGLEMLLPILRIFPSKSREEIKATAELFKKTIFNVSVFFGSCLLRDNFYTHSAKLGKTYYC